jgi:hypothetical protein
MAVKAAAQSTLPINLNPYQGLKQNIIQVFYSSGILLINLNLYQELKLE